MTPPTTRRPKTRAAKRAGADASAPTVAQLRERARELGIRGYSRMRKDELEHELAARESVPPPAAVPAAATARPARPSTPEAAPSATRPATPPAGALNEDVDRLPAAREPQLGLLPQRPGVVQAYWVLPLEMTRSLPPLHLRLLRADTDRDPLIAELPVAAGSGHHYFQFADSIDPGAVYLQLGYYDSSRRFVNAIGHRLAQVPSLHAAPGDPRTAPADAARFRELYLQAGGVERDGRLGWSNSTSSPAAPFSAPSSPPFNR